MALTDSFPGPNGLTDSIEAGKDLAGLIASNPDGTPRAGILAKGPGALVTGRSDLRVDIAPFKAALVRDGAVRLIANDSVAQSPAFTLPTANSRIDVLYVKVNETPADATDGPMFGILEGAAAPIPTRPVLNIPGALELCTVPLAASDTTTAAAPIANTAPVTAAAGVALSPEIGSFAFGALYRAHGLWQPPKLEKEGKRVHFHGTVTINQTVSFLSGTAYVLGTLPPGFRPKPGGQVLQSAAVSPGIGAWVGAYVGGTVEFALLNATTMGADGWILGFDLWWDVA